MDDALKEKGREGYRSGDSFQWISLVIYSCYLLIYNCLYTLLVQMFSIFFCLSAPDRNIQTGMGIAAHFLLVIFHFLYRRSSYMIFFFTISTFPSPRGSPTVIALDHS